MMAARTPVFLKREDPALPLHLAQIFISKENTRNSP